jgi:hypothetical protein
VGEACVRIGPCIVSVGHCCSQGDSAVAQKLRTEEKHTHEPVCHKTDASLCYHGTSQMLLVTCWNHLLLGAFTLVGYHISLTLLL